VVELFRADRHLRAATYDIAFGYETSENASNLIARTLEIPPDKSFMTHAQLGNIASPSVRST